MTWEGQKFLQVFTLFKCPNYGLLLEKKIKNTGCPKKNSAMFQTVITPSKLELGIRVGQILKSSGSPLNDGFIAGSILDDIDNIYEDLRILATILRTILNYKRLCPSVCVCVSVCPMII